MTLRPYSVSPRVDRPDPGPEPEEELGDLHAGRLAMMKWPSSWRMIMTTRPSTMTRPHQPAAGQQHQGGQHEPTTPDPRPTRPARAGSSLVGPAAGSSVLERAVGHVGPRWGRHRSGVGPVEQGGGQPRGPAVDLDHGVDVVERRPSCRESAVGEDVRDGDPGDPPVEEGRHRHLVGRVEPGRRRSRRRGRPRRPGPGRGTPRGRGARSRGAPSEVQSMRPNGVARRSGQARA